MQYLHVLRKRKLVALLCVLAELNVDVSVLCLFLTVPWVGLWSVIISDCGISFLQILCSG